jgi:hypothetical protein
MVAKFNVGLYMGKTSPVAQSTTMKYVGTKTCSRGILPVANTGYYSCVGRKLVTGGLPPTFFCGSSYDRESVYFETWIIQ